MPTHHKLVRDRIPEIIKNSGKQLKTKTLSEDRYIEELKKKLNEEVAEYQEAATDGRALEELADILELMHALTHQHGATIKEVEQIRTKKADERAVLKIKFF
ncbi:uncharacterized protein JNUCC1_01452 [Lentibacillus sp. JNUCC-1]|uniref:nucleoside triphosphate pyrophosphohydrolase n=1 Tax=Lentibacillus sp. JNUCC-1 TaxID=2654513 RepID=UPI001327655D|nr:uncharacterized protein [Lentibacillus sp. JNUCC-1]